MKKLKKLLGIVCLSLAVTLICNLTVGASSINENNENWVECEEDIYTIIDERFMQESDYGGAYFKDNIFYIATTDVPTFEDLRKKLIAEEEIIGDEILDVVFTQVEYTEKELLEIRRNIVDNADILLKGYNVIGSYTDPINNTVVIDITNPVTYQSDSIQRKTGFDNITFRQVPDEEAKDDATTYIRGGYKIVDKTAGWAFSLGCGIKWSSTGEYGFLTTAHNSVSEDDIFTYSSVEIGKVSTVKNSNGLDVALIKRTNSSYTVSNKNGTSGKVCTLSGAPKVGDMVVLYGVNNEGGTAKEITSITYEKTISGAYHTNLILSSYTCIDGDSGGALITTRSNGDVVFVGIHKAHISTESYGIRWDLIRDTYGLTRFSVTEP